MICDKCQGDGLFNGSQKCMRCDGHGVIDEKRAIWLINTWYPQRVLLGQISQIVADREIENLFSHHPQLRPQQIEVAKQEDQEVDLSEIKEIARDMLVWAKAKQRRNNGDLVREWAKDLFKAIKQIERTI